MPKDNKVNVCKVMRERKCEPRILYPVRCCSNKESKRRQSQI